MGWLEGQGTHRDLGSLIVAVRSGDRWAHAGQVGSGIDTKTRRELRITLDELARDTSVLDPVPRLKGAHWVEPKLVIRVEFADWTADDLLRQAAFKGLEIGKAPTSVRREREVDATTASAAAEREVHTAPMQTDDAAAALEAIEREGIWQVAGREVRVTNLDKVLFPGRDGNAAVTKRDLFRYHLAVGADAGPVSPRSWAHGPAIPERRRGEGLLAEGSAEARAGMGQALDLPPPRGGAEGLPGGRRAGDPDLARAGGGHRAAPVDLAGRDAGSTVVRADRHRPRTGHDLGRGRGAGAPVPDRAEPPGRARISEGDRKAGDPGLDPHPSRSRLSPTRAPGSRDSRAPSARRCPTWSAGSGRSGRAGARLGSTTPRTRSTRRSSRRTARDRRPVPR